MDPLSQVRAKGSVGGERCKAARQVTSTERLGRLSFQAIGLGSLVRLDEPHVKLETKTGRWERADVE